MKGLALGAALLLSTSARAAPVVLEERKVFPGTDGARAALLDQPLTAAIAAYQKASGKQRFKKRFVIHKARRRMDVYADDALLKSYVINLGPEPVGDKGREGDGKTPEGELFVCSVNRVSQFTRFLALAYPTPALASRAAKSGAISAASARETERAYQSRRACPPQTTPLGGMVGIHGKGGYAHLAGRYTLVDWTLGCIGLRDADILELFDHYAEVGIPVQILAE